MTGSDDCGLSGTYECASASASEITGLYACDLLSRVMSKAESGNAWITVHSHLNIVAVAVFAEIPCIVLPEGIKAEDATIKRAEAEGIVILGTDLSVYEICRRYPD
ncbi:MAG: AraC family transcriptional regulator [Clostridiales bacterium]|nr:AraC family transcriptional regulator [Clostridiales bacterium]